jgi:SAM-dependent methyltransferase
MPANEWYKNWFNSPFYHKLYFERDESEAKNFIKKLIDHFNPSPAGRMLDIACGKGRHSKILASYGFDVTGFDISGDSIEEANRHATERLHFFVHDMRLPFWVNYYDFGFNFFTSFGYFSTRREHDDAIRTIAASMKKGGTIIFDYLNVHFAEDHLVHNEVKSIDNTSYEIHRWHNDHHFFKKMIVTDPTLSNPLEFTEQVAKFSLGDFTEMLAFQGMQVTEVFGDYGLNAYDVRKTPRMIVAARKI